MYKTPKNLKLKKRKMEVNAPKEPSLSTTSVVEIKGLKLKRAPIDMGKMAEEPKKKD